MKTITFHSYKGGTGKSYLSSNIAAILAKKKKVCLLDMDLTAPTLKTLFRITDWKNWLNDYLEGDRNYSDVLYKINGVDLFLGMADTKPESIRHAVGKSKSREMNTLKRLLSMKAALADDDFDFLIIDTSPGYSYSSINSIAAADKSGIILTPYQPDIVGTTEMLKGLYDALDKSTFMIFNRYHSLKIFEDYKSEMKRGYNGSIYGMKCFCDYTEEMGSRVICLDEIEHSLYNAFKDLASDIEIEFQN